MMMIALLFSTAISQPPEAYPADWANEGDETPDLALGSGNNWWLRLNEAGSLYIQSRSPALDNDYTVSIADRMLDVDLALARRIELAAGTVVVSLPWSASEIQLTSAAMRHKSRLLDESIRKKHTQEIITRKRLKAKLKTLQQYVDELLQNVLRD
jgi:hypothetical protein